MVDVRLLTLKETYQELAKAFLLVCDLWRMMLSTINFIIEILFMLHADSLQFITIM